MREVRQLQNELEEPTSAPSVTPSGDTTPLPWDPKALPQHDDLVSDSQPNHTTETPKTTELSHWVLESIQNHKLQVTMRDVFSLFLSLTEFVRSRLTEVVTQPSKTPTTEELIAATEARVVYCVVTDPALSQRHDKIGMMTARHSVEPCRYRDGGGKWGNFIVTRGQPRWISHGHVS